MRGVGPRMKGPVPQRKRIVLSLAIYGARPDPEAVLRELLPHLVAGLENTEIADAMGCSSANVKALLSAVMTKFGVKNRVSVAVHAVRAGLVPTV